MNEKKTRNIFASAGLVTLMILLFKVIGFIKQSVVAYYYGANVSTDTYFIANTFISGANEIIVVSLSIALISAYTECIEKRGNDEGNRYISNVLSVAMVIGVVSVSLVIVLSPMIATLLLGGNTDIDKEELSGYIRMLSPILIFSLFEMVSASILDAHKSYFIPRLRSLLYSTAVIACCIFLSYQFKIKALIFGHYLSRITYTIILILSISKFAKVKLRIPVLSDEVKQLLRLAFPLVIGNGIVQINRIVDQSIASRLSAGSSSSLSYCQVLEDFVVATIISNVGNVLFANFAQLIAKGKNDEIKGLMNRVINLFLCILVPISILTIMCSREIVSIVYYRGAFDNNALSMTSIALIGYAVAFPFFGIRDLMLKSLYAHRDTLWPMIASFICMAINIVLSIILSQQYGIFGITFATSISAVLGTFISVKMVNRYISIRFLREHGKVMIKVIAATLFLVGITMLLRSLPIHNKMLSFGLIVFVGFSVYFIVLYLLKVEEVRGIITSIRKRVHI